MSNLIVKAIRKYQFVNFEVSGLIGARLLSNVPVNKVVVLALRDMVSYTFKSKSYATKCVGTHTVIADVNKHLSNKRFSSKKELAGWYFQQANMSYRKLAK